MARHLDKFTKAFRQSRIPFLLAEVVTNGSGELVDLTCRFVNAPAAALLGAPAEELKNRRFSRTLPSRLLTDFAPLGTVAFSGSAVSFPCQAVTGAELNVTCYQVMYGTVGCILEPRSDAARSSADPLMETLPAAAAVLELGRGGLRCLSLNQQLCALTGWSRRELLDHYADDLSSLVHPEDWPALLQDLLDAAREQRSVDHEFRLLRREGHPLWVDLRAERLPTAAGTAAFYAMLLDIDEPRRTQERLAEALSQLELSQSQLHALFDTLPGGCAVFRLLPEGSFAPLLLSRKLAEMLGYTGAELRRRLQSDPASRIYPPDREALSAAALRARVNGAPLRHTCRLRAKGGRVLWASLEAVWQAQDDGSALFYVICTDVTAEKETEAELRLRTQLCDLLLDRSHIISFDYDPATEVAHLETYDQGGHRSSQQVEHFLDALESSPTVHPEDRKRLATALRRASARPGTGTLEYRGNYNGLGWRWYRMSLVSLFDSKGNVYSLLAKAEDISDRRSAAQRSRELAAQYKKQAKASLAAARLDLSGDRILDARGGSRHLMRVLFGNSAEACLRHIRDNIPDSTQREEFSRRFNPPALLDAFHHGCVHHELEHRFTLESGAAVWVRSVLELAEAPETHRVEAFYHIIDVDTEHHRSALLDALAQRDYETVLTVDAASGLCRSYGSRMAVPAGTSYRSLAVRYAQQQPPGRQRSILRQAIRLETILEQLDQQDVYEILCQGEAADGPRSQRVRCSWLDRKDGLLLVTMENA